MSARNFYWKGKAINEQIGKEALAKAEKLASSNDLYAVKSFLGKIGTNRIVRDKKVLLDFVEPYNLILKYRAVGGRGGSMRWKRCGQKKRTSSQID